MKHFAIGIFLLSSSAAAFADDNEWNLLADPQARAAAKAGPRIWAETEMFAGLLEATDASGSGPNVADFNTESDFNDDIDTWIQQAIFTLNGGYELDFGLTIYGRVGYAIPTINQDIDAASLVIGGTDERHGGAVDKVFVYGLGVSFRREVASKFVLMGGVEWMIGSGEYNQTEFQDVRGDGDVDFSWIRLRAAGGLVTDLAILYFGVRFTLAEIEIDFQADPGTDQFNVTYELDQPAGVFIGAASKIGEKSLWHVEIGLLDGLSFDLGVGFAF